METVLGLIKNQIGTFFCVPHVFVKKRFLFFACHLKKDFCLTINYLCIENFLSDFMSGVHFQSSKKLNT